MNQNVMTVGQLEKKLLKVFPAEDADEWDRTGLRVGDCEDVVRGVVVCLDPTVDAVRYAVNHGCNVLVTHHPVFLDPPTFFGPLSPGNPAAGSVVFEAIRNNVALINFHTTLDYSPLVAASYPNQIGLVCDELMEPMGGNPFLGYGHICHTDQPIALGSLAQRIQQAWGGSPRMWGDSSTMISSVVTCTGSGGTELAEKCLERGDIDCLVTGEIKYHVAQAAAQRGLAILDLGHDISEFPLCGYLVSSVQEAGVPAERVRYLDQRDNWQ